MRSASIATTGTVAAAGNPKLPVPPIKYTLLNDIRLTAASQVVRFTPSSGGANTGTSTTDTTAPIPGGQTSQVRLTSVGYNGSYYGITLATPWDMSNGFFRYQMRTDYTKTRGGFSWRFATSKAAHDAGNYLTYKVSGGSAQPNWFPINTYVWDSAHPGIMTTTGTAPALSSIGYLVLNVLDVNTSTTNIWDLARIQNVQIAASARAKCVIWHDDSVTSGAEPIWSKMAAYGWAASEATEWETIAVDGSGFPYTKYIASGWQLGSHSTTGPEHIGVAADSVANQAYRNKIADTRLHANKGSADFAYWGGLDSSVAYPVLQRLYRSARWNTSQLAYPETQPPGDPHMMKSWLVVSNDLATAWETLLTNAIATKGIASFVFHQDIGSNPATAAEFDKLLTWLDGNRASIDVVTISAALTASIV